MRTATPCADVSSNGSGFSAGEAGGCAACSSVVVVVRSCRRDSAAEGAGAAAALGGVGCGGWCGGGTNRGVHASTTRCRICGVIRCSAPSSSARAAACTSSVGSQ